MVSLPAMWAFPEHDPEKWTPVFGKDHAQTIAFLAGLIAMAGAGA
jgi:hypothetical protein